MRFDSLLQFQKPIIKFLQNSYRKDRVVHTFLFDGAKGTYQIEAAYYLASLLLCTNEGDKPCLKCTDCKRILGEKHPRVYKIQPDKESIKKEQIEALLHEFSMTGLEEGTRVFIIDQIDKATAAAANSLLKFLEETNPNVYGVLITQELQNVIPTIVSRSMVVSFSKLPRDSFVDLLMKEGYQEEVAKAAFTFTNSIEEAKEILEDPLIVPIIDLSIKVGEAIVHREPYHPSLVLAFEGQFLTKEPAKKYHRMFLNLLISYTNDKLYYRLNHMEGITFKNSMERVKDYIVDDTKTYIDEMEHILKTRDRLHFSVNTELLYHQMFIEIVR
jgi:DNA polymerase III subunit delta'